MSVEKVNKLLNKIGKNFYFYQSKQDGKLFILNPPEKTCEALEYVYKAKTPEEKQLITHLIAVLKNQESRLKYSLLMLNFGLYSDKKYQQLRKIWEE